MGTNPVHMANGGDVRAGIPSYPDANVTRGFLPAALGFDNGGEADKDAVTKIYDFIFGYFKNVLGLDDEEAKEETKETIKDPEKVKEIITQIPIGKSPSFDDIETGKFEGMPPSTVTPIDTGKAPERIAPKADEIWPTVPEQPIVPEQRIAPKADEVWPTQEGGITEISPAERFKPEEKDIILPDAEKAGMLDLNGDGVIDGRDLEIAIQKFPHLVEWIKKYIKGFTEGDQEDKPLEKDIVVPEGLPPSHPDSPGKKSIVPEEKIIPKIKPEPDEPIIPKGGITSIEELPISHTEHPSKKIGKDEQTLLKMPKNIEETDKTKGKGLQKDIPPWAIPLMSAGFKMMASKSPYFMQALGEAGETGLETYAGIEKAKTEKEKSEAQIKKDLAWADYYTAGGAGGKPTIITDTEGRRVYAIFNKKTNQYDPILTAGGTPQYAVRSNAEIDEYLSGIHLNWASMSEDEKNKYRDEQINRDLGIALTNVASGTEEDKGPGIFEKGGKYIKGFFSKDGGIVSLRR